MDTRYETPTILPHVGGHRFAVASIGADRVEVLRDEHRELTALACVLLQCAPTDLTRDQVRETLARHAEAETTPGVRRVHRITVSVLFATPEAATAALQARGLL